MLSPWTNPPTKPMTITGEAEDSAEESAAAGVARRNMPKIKAVKKMSLRIYMGGGARNTTKKRFRSQTQHQPPWICAESERGATHICGALHAVPLRMQTDGQRARGRLKVGRCTRSDCGTGSTGSPALRQAARPPTMTNALNPWSRRRCATRALVASRRQVQ